MEIEIQMSIPKGSILASKAKSTIDIEHMYTVEVVNFITARDDFNIFGEGTLITVKGDILYIKRFCDDCLTLIDRD